MVMSMVLKFENEISVRRSLETFLHSAGLTGVGYSVTLFLGGEPQQITRYDHVAMPSYDCSGDHASPNTRTTQRI